jgi:hypothetical protein
MQGKGFSRDEIKDRLQNVGWSQTAIDKYLRDEVLNASFSEKGSEEIETFAEYGKFLLGDECIESHYKLGMNTLIITDKRLLVLRKFPKNISEFYYADIELVEFYTAIRWVRLGYALLYFFGMFIFFFFRQGIWEKVAAILPASASFFNFRPFLGMDLATILVVGYFLTYFFIDIFSFASSFMGRVRILPKNLGPKEIIARYTGDVEEFLEKVDEKLENQHEEKE